MKMDDNKGPWQGMKKDSNEENSQRTMTRDDSDDINNNKDNKDNTTSNKDNKKITTSKILTFMII